MPYHHRFGYAKGLWAFHNIYTSVVRDRYHYGKLLIVLVVCLCD